MEALCTYQNNHHQLTGVIASGYVINLVYVCMSNVEWTTLKLNYNRVVCSTPQQIELCYFLAYKEHSII